MLIRYLKKIATKFLWFFSKTIRLHAINKSLLEINYFNLVNSEKYKNSKNLIRYGFKVYSQSDEDGIIKEIFNRIGIKNKKFIELGIQDGLECNTTFLLFAGWQGVWIDMSTNLNKLKDDFRDYFGTKLLFKKNIITKNNVNKLLDEYKNFLTNEVDLLSIDLSKNTFHILSEFNLFNPRVVVTEYNAKHRDDIEWVCKYDENGNWDGSDNFGASLKSFEIMMKKKNYSLVACNITGVNAFFVRKDLINEKFFDNYDSEFHYEPLRSWLVKKFENEIEPKI